MRDPAYLNLDSDKTPFEQDVIGYADDRIADGPAKGWSSFDIADYLPYYRDSRRAGLGSTYCSRASHCEHRSKFGAKDLSATRPSEYRFRVNKRTKRVAR